MDGLLRKVSRGTWRFWEPVFTQNPYQVALLFVPYALPHRITLAVLVVP